jgi:L-threonylcarbamoyladenylate synthase
MIILLDSFTKIRNYVSAIPGITRDLVMNADAPLTIIYPGARNLADNVIAPDQTIAIRIVKDKFCRRLIREFGKPIVSTSANISGEAPPLIFRHITPEITQGVDHVVDSSLAHLKNVKASQIIKLETNGEFRIIRK